MSEYPILFKGEMVKAILEGRKTQTRRVMDPQPYTQPYIMINGPWWAECDPSDDNEPIRPKKCPYGKVGDRLWVRETWNGTQGEGVAYRSTEPQMDGETWRPSIFMPRWASRITLDVGKVRVERVQDITQADAKAEGVNLETWKFHKAHDQTINLGLAALTEFERLWDKINGRPKPVMIDGKIHHYVSYPWESINEVRTYRGKEWYVIGNPWVWVVDFQKVNQG